MADDLVKRATEALDGVTPGPWASDFMLNVWGQGKGRHGKIANLADRPQASTYDEIPEQEVRNNASFIAWARGDEARTYGVPAMADRIRELEAKLAKAREAAFEGRTDLMIAADNARDAAKTDHRWEGVADVLMRRVRQIDATLKEIGNG